MLSEPQDFRWLNDFPDALMLLDERGKVCRWSAGAAEMFGFSNDQAIGNLVYDLIVLPDHAKEQGRYLRETLRNGRGTFEALRRRRDGTLIYVDISGKVVAANGDGATTPCLMFSEKDVTSLKVQRDSAALELRFRELLESTPDGIVIVNPTGHILIANSQAERLFGYAPDEIRAKPIEFLLPERYRGSHKGHRSLYFSQPRARAMGAGLELYGLRKDGTEFPVEISLSPLKTEETPLVMSAIRDVSERRRFEKALQDKNVELENANRAKDRFLASMSHELRTPLNAVIGFTGTLLMKLPGDLNAEQTHQLDVVRSNARHLLALINDLLNLAKIEAGKVELNMEPTDCAMLVQEMCASLRPQAVAKDLQLLVEVPAQAMFCTDRRALSQIMINLTNNAIKFTASGRVRVRLSLADTERGRELELVVEDTGPGISEEDRAAIFEAFVRGKSAQQTGVEGTGLGLHLSGKLAQLLHGELRCDSTPGVGSAFVLSLREV